mgnify:CR=1 FL=1|tara:strand:+ start:167 stop:346 length:180 start_codon:yes stop_codon:yes gene_type:complete
MMNWSRLGLVGCLLSILLSIGVFFTHDENLGIFIGLWASAILLLSDRIPKVLSEQKSQE